MGAKNNRKCMICDKNYRFCPTCSSDRSKPIWMNMFDNENCKNIFDILTDVTFKNITVENAKELLQLCDLSEMESFNELTKSQLASILLTETAESESAVVKEEAKKKEKAVK